jgi:hypothetical protein
MELIRRRAAVNAHEVRNPGVILGTEDAKPWGAYAVTATHF